MLITGVNGFIGRHTALAFQKAGFKVRGVDLQPNCFDSQIEYRTCDLTDESNLQDALRDLEFDHVIHLAAVLAMDSPATLHINILAAYHILRLACAKHCLSFIHLSSIPVIGLPPMDGEIDESSPISPRTAYHVSKHTSEQLVMLPGFAGMRRYNIRIPSPIGPGMPRSFLRIMLERALMGEKLTIYGSGSRVQNYLDARDIAMALVSVVRTGPEEGLYLLGGEAISNLNIVELCSEIVGGECEIVRTGEPDPADGERWRVNTEKARIAFGFIPQYTIRRSVEDLANELRCVF